MRQLQLYVKEIRGAVCVIGVAPGKDLYVLGSRANVQEAVGHALVYARLLGVPEREIYVGGHSIPQLAMLGAELVVSSIKNEGEDRHC
ncbi:hypothetical protein ACFFK0_15630 [Paenibacillus chartarius]|uniref:Uncharacterized protein n=1 Tax=Paenibacillus chartarius TaxID=747481 RepID=A0ABV6DMJ1_9BACL